MYAIIKHLSNVYYGVQEAPVIDRCQSTGEASRLQLATGYSISPCDTQQLQSMLKMWVSKNMDF